MLSNIIFRCVDVLVKTLAGQLKNNYYSLFFFLFSLKYIACYIRYANLILEFKNIFSLRNKPCYALDANYYLFYHIIATIYKTKTNP